jgi:hypothetical protein
MAGWAPYGVAGATLAAGVLVALLRRRGAFGRPDEDAEPEVDLRLAADLPLAQWVDRALRDLSQRLDVEGPRPAAGVRRPARRRRPLARAVTRRTRRASPLAGRCRRTHLDLAGRRRHRPG